jgi:hypothetical protein
LAFNSDTDAVQVDIRSPEWAARKSQLVAKGQRFRAAQQAHRIMANRLTRAPGRLFKRGSATYYDALPTAKIPTDRGAMSATFTVSTRRPDREEDVIIPEGVSFSAYRLNPVVLWDHGFSAISLPIGTSEDPAGNLAVFVTPDRIDATCYFSQTLPEAEQIFELVDEGTIRAASIHVRPIEFTVRANRGADERPGLLVTASEMLEWSIVPVGCNPEAVRKALIDGRLLGRPLIPSIRKFLQEAY